MSHSNPDRFSHLGWGGFVVMAVGISLACSVPPPPPEVPVKDYPVDEPFVIEADRVVQGQDKMAIALSRDEIRSTYTPQERTWKRSADLDPFPDFQAPSMPILEAVTRLALEEALLNIIPSGERQGAFMAGAKWPGVWTRDISYAIHLSLAWILPRESERSLRVKVNNLPEVVQDTGTGGSWPVSTDRVVWALAAWELYLAHGNRNWLRDAYTILRNTALRDRQFAFDELSGLYRGETSFMDWREQTYPHWMTPVDIYESRAFGTNVLHWFALRTLERMGRELGVSEAEVRQWATWAEALGQAILGRFWLEEKGYFSAYAYGPWQEGLKTDKSDTLANSLGVLLGLVREERAVRLMRSLPVVSFGPPIIYPQIPNIPPYHNRGIWPFVTAYYSLAGASVGNLEAMAHGLRSNLRAAALFLTHKENMVFSNGHFIGTQVNSDRQLWSVSGWLAQVYRGLLGLDIRLNGLAFRPAVPEGFTGPFRLVGFRWRGHTVNLTVSGVGDRVVELRVNGEEKGPQFVIPPEGEGTWEVEIRLEGRSRPGGVHLGSVAAFGTRETRTRARLESNKLVVEWDDTGYDVPFAVFERSTLLGTVRGTRAEFPPPSLDRVLSVSVQALDPEGYPANLGSYALAFPSGTRVEIPAVEGIYPAELRQPGLAELGLDRDFLDLTGRPGEQVEWQVTLPRSGLWALRFRYANGSGPISTDNKCALRTVVVDGRAVGKAVFPQTGEWTDRLWSAATFLRLTPGRRRIGLALRPEDSNMDGTVNQVVIDLVELILVEN